MQKRPIPALDLEQVSTAIGERQVDLSGCSTVVVTHGMWDCAGKDARAIFINMCRIYGLKYRLESPALGGVYLE